MRDDSEAEAEASNTRPPGVIVQEVISAAQLRGAEDAASRLWRLARDWAAPVRVVVVGERSRGKSTLVNAILAHDVLPTDVDVTSNTYVEITGSRRGDDRGDVAAVLFEGNAKPTPIRLADIAAVASEGGNPRNTKNVAGVLVRLNNPLLASGLSLVDTPGVGSLLSGHGQMTAEVVEHADGVIVVLSAVKELSSDELFFIETLNPNTPVILAMNRMDEVQADDTGRDPLQVVLAANRRHLAKWIPARAEAPLVAVSALMARDGQRGDDEQLLTESGLPDLVRSIDRHLLGPRRWVATMALFEACRLVLAELAARDLAIVQPPAADELGAELARLRVLTKELRRAQPRQALRRGAKDRVGDAQDRASNDLAKLLRNYLGQIEDKARWKESEIDALIDDFDTALRATWSSWVRELGRGVDRDTAEVARRLGIDSPVIVVDPRYPGHLVDAPMPRPRRGGIKVTTVFDFAMSLLLSPFRLVENLKKLITQSERHAHNKKELRDVLDARVRSVKEVGRRQLGREEEALRDAAVRDIESRQREKLAVLEQRLIDLESSQDEQARRAATDRLARLQTLDRAIVEHLRLVSDKLSAAPSAQFAPRIRRTVSVLALDLGDLVVRGAALSDHDRGVPQPVAFGPARRESLDCLVVDGHLVPPTATTKLHRPTAVSWPLTRLEATGNRPDPDLDDALGTLLRSAVRLSPQLPDRVVLCYRPTWPAASVAVARLTRVARQALDGSDVELVNGAIAAAWCINPRPPQGSRLAACDIGALASRLVTLERRATDFAVLQRRRLPIGAEHLLDAIQGGLEALGADVPTARGRRRISTRLATGATVTIGGGPLVLTAAGVASALEDDVDALVLALSEAAAAAESGRDLPVLFIGGGAAGGFFTDRLRAVDGIAAIVPKNVAHTSALGAVLRDVARRPNRAGNSAHADTDATSGPDETLAVATAQAAIQKLGVAAYNSSVPVRRLVRDRVCFNLHLNTSLAELSANLDSALDGTLSFENINDVRFRRRVNAHLAEEDRRLTVSVLAHSSVSNLWAANRHVYLVAHDHWTTAAGQLEDSGVPVLGFIALTNFRETRLAENVNRLLHAVKFSERRSYL